MLSASPAHDRLGADDSIAGSHPPRRRVRRRAVCRVVCIVAAITVIVTAVALIFPAAVPTVMQAIRDNPLAPVLVATCWLVATSASVAGKRAVSGGHLCWTTATTSHIGGTVANRVVPGGVGAAGAFVAALRRGGASATGAVGVVTLWAVAGAAGHAGGLLLSLAWLRDGWEDLLTILAAMVVLIVAGPTLARRIAAAVRAVTSGGPRTRRSERPPSRSRPVRAVRARAGQLASTAREVVSAARARPIVAAAAVATQTVSILCLAIGFALAVTTFGLPVPLTTAVAVYFAGTALSAATPTPAGIGSTEAALVGALVVAGATVGEALPAVLLYRAVVLLVPVVAAALIAVGWLAVSWATRLACPGSTPKRGWQELWTSRPVRT